MAEPITVDNGDLTDYAVLVDDVTDATLGTGAKQIVGLADATIGSTTKVAAGGGAEANALRVTVASDSTGVLSVDDNGGSLTVDGTVTTTPSGDHTVVGKAADGAAVSGNPVLVAGQDGTNVQSLKTDATGSLQVDVESSALPSGAATAANQSTVIGHLDGVEALLTTIDADTGTLAGAVAGTEVQVDVLSVVPGTAATSLGKAEDAAHTTGDTGVMALAVRNDGGSALAGTDGDYIPLTTDSAGALRVTGGGGGTQYTEGDTDTTITGTAMLWEDASDTLRAVSSGKPLPVNVVSGAAGGVTHTDDAAFTAGADDVVPAAAMFDDTTPDSVDEGDAGVLRMSANRNLYSTIRDAAGNERGANVTAGNALVVDGSAVTQPVSHAALTELAAAIDTEVQVDVVGALPAGTNAIGKLAANSGVDIGDVDVTSVVPGTGASSLGKAEDAVHASGDTGVYVLAVRDDTLAAHSGADGDYESLHTNADGALWVKHSGNIDVNSHAVTNAGTFAVQESGSALTALQLLDDTIIADDAAFTVATTKTSVAGFLADETSTDSVDEGDAGAARMTLDRRQIVVNQPHAAGGCTIFRSLDLDETEEEVKATAGTLYGWYIANTATSTRFVKFYNDTAANVTVGTTTPVLTLPIPGNSSDDVGANLLGGVGIAFDTAITVAATTGVADADTGAPGANEVIVNLFYK